MNKLNTLDWIALGLLIVGGINWGMIGAFNFDLVSSLFGVMSVISRLVYALVGISAVYAVYVLFTKTQ